MDDSFSEAVTLVNELGLHLRAAGRFVQLASRYKATISIEHEGVVVDGKSIMGLLSLAVACGCSITIRATGTDAAAAIQALINLVKRGFEEN